MKLGAAQPTALEAIPKQDGVHLPGELIDLPHPVVLNGLAGRIEWQTVEFAKRVDFAPVRTNVTVLQSYVIGPVSPPAWPSPTLVKTLTLHHEFGNPADGLSDPTRFLCGEFAGANTVTLWIITAKQPCDGDAIRIADGVALRILPDQGPGRLETTA